eukprot:COSAG03_NODE_26572_length_258_cov_0.874214_1_plen_34_part_10
MEHTNNMKLYATTTVHAKDVATTIMPCIMQRAGC